MEDRDQGFERFTEDARLVLIFAQQEARRLNHGYIGTEHVLLGLLRASAGAAAGVLVGLGVQLDHARQTVEFTIGRRDRMVQGDVGLTPRAKRVIQLAVEQTRQRGHPYIGTEHLLAGLVDEGGGIGAGVLASLGVTTARLNERLATVLPPGMSAAQPGTGHAADPGRLPPGSSPAAARPASTRRQPFSLGRLAKVITGGETKQWRNGEATLLSLESFGHGFTVQLRLRLDAAGRGRAAGLNNLPFEAVDDLSTRYSGGGLNSRGSLWGQRGLDERWTSILFLPALDPDARELRMFGPESWVAEPDGMTPLEMATRRCFVVALSTP